MSKPITLYGIEFKSKAELRGALGLPLIRVNKEHTIEKYFEEHFYTKNVPLSLKRYYIEYMRNAYRSKDLSKKMFFPRQKN